MFVTIVIIVFIIAIGSTTFEFSNLFHFQIYLQGAIQSRLCSCQSCNSYIITIISIITSIIILVIAVILFIILIMEVESRERCWSVSWAVL